MRSVRGAYAAFLLFFFNATGTTEIYTLSLHDALPISATAVNVAATANAPLKMRNSPMKPFRPGRSEEHTSELQSRQYLVCRLLLEKKKNTDRRSRVAASETLTNPAPTVRAVEALAQPT